MRIRSTSVRWQVLALAGPFLLFACGRAPLEGRDARSVEYVGAATCASCHPAEFEGWTGSHHDLAMQPATEETVLGDFDDALFELDGVPTRFFKRDGQFFVHTQGADGAFADFSVDYVFGVEPLQQILLRGEGGRFQCLTVAWDVVGERWYDLYPDQETTAGDAMHWTGVYQSWNAMCADCHSTNLRKGYDVATRTYDTTFSEIDVACEACHGPGEAHVTWAQASGSGTEPADMGLVANLRRGSPETQLNACAPCHSRRTMITADPTPGGAFHNDYLLQRLNEGSYHDDGQILEEVYVVGSFLQSKMHQRGVACSDCHDPHSLELWVPGNAVCLQCHSTEAPLDRFSTLQAKVYDSPEHHFHAQDSEGAKCVNCHMVERTYMGVDPRRDHSLRIPRPDVSTVMGTPNACNDCHTDQTAEWAATAVDDWYGVDRQRQPTFAPLFLRARLGDAEVIPELMGLAANTEQPGIVRATAVDYLRPAGAKAWQLMLSLVDDEDTMVRQAAIGALEEAPEQVRSQVLVYNLDDEARTVRMEAARALASVPASTIDEKFKPALERAQAEFDLAQEFSIDFPWSHLNLALAHQARGATRSAIEAYQDALEIDPLFTPARFNLANVLNTSGRNPEAVELLQEGTRLEPENGDVFYSLGLALAEEGQAEESADALLRAATLLPDRPRVHYNAALALQGVNRMADAEAQLIQSVRLNPTDAEAIHALTLLYIELEAWPNARAQATTLQGLFPDAPWIAELFEQIDVGSEH
ncbi:MAG: tetratricopeptide (TPR) repeat protein [Chlamydiales bacterium]|jgi:tetratricopeptide (TPR) repeat protein